MAPSSPTVTAAPLGSYWSLCGTAGLGSTVTSTLTSSVESSGYVTTTVAVTLPGASVLKCSFHAALVPPGSSPMLAMALAAGGIRPCCVVTDCPFAVYFSASERVSFTWTGTVSTS